MIRKLIIGNGRMERELLLVGNIVIGRDPACHVSEPDPLLSRRHAEVIVNVHGVSVRDLNSRNGILVNGAKTREQVLLPGDVVQLGHMQLRYVEENVRTTDAQARGMDPRRQPQPQPPAYDVDRFRPEPTPQPSRWRPEPTPLPAARRPAPPTPQKAEGRKINTIRNAPSVKPFLMFLKFSRAPSAHDGRVCVPVFPEKGK